MNNLKIEKNKLKQEFENEIVKKDEEMNINIEKNNKELKLKTQENKKLNEMI